MDNYNIKKLLECDSIDKRNENSNFLLQKSKIDNSSRNEKLDTVQDLEFNDSITALRKRAPDFEDSDDLPKLPVFKRPNDFKEELYGDLKMTKVNSMHHFKDPLKLKRSRSQNVERRKGDFLLFVLNAFEKSIYLYTNIVYGIICHQKNEAAKLMSYNIYWSMFAESIEELREDFLFLENAMNKWMKNNCAKYPPHPKFSIWRLSTKIWVKQVYEPLNKQLRNIFTKILTNFRIEVLTKIKKEIKNTNQNEIEYSNEQALIPDLDLALQQQGSSRLKNNGDHNKELPKYTPEEEEMLMTWNCDISENIAEQEMMEPVLNKNKSFTLEINYSPTKKFKNELGISPDKTNLRINGNEIIPPFEMTDGSIDLGHSVLSGPHKITSSTMKIDYSQFTNDRVLKDLFEFINFPEPNYDWIIQILNKFAISIADISFNEVTIHYKESTKVNVGMPYKNLEDEILKKTEKIYKNFQFIPDELKSYYKFFNEDCRIISQIFLKTSFKKHMNLVSNIAVKSITQDIQILNESKESFKSDNYFEAAPLSKNDIPKTLSTTKKIDLVKTDNQRLFEVDPFPELEDKLELSLKKAFSCHTKINDKGKKKRDSNKSRMKGSVREIKTIDVQSTSPTNNNNLEKNFKQINTKLVKFK